jgi:hypothetical protein
MRPWLITTPTKRRSTEILKRKRGRRRRSNDNIAADRHGPGEESTMDADLVAAFRSGGTTVIGSGRRTQREARRYSDSQLGSSWAAFCVRGQTCRPRVCGTGPNSSAVGVDLRWYRQGHLESFQSFAVPIRRSRPAAAAKARKSRSLVRRGIPRSIQLWAIRASPRRALRRCASAFARDSPARCQ